MMYCAEGWRCVTSGWEQSLVEHTHSTHDTMQDAITAKYKMEENRHTRRGRIIQEIFEVDENGNRALSGRSFESNVG